MSYGEYKFGDFMKNYDVGGPSDGLVGFAEGFAKGFVPAYAASNKAAADKELALAKLDKQAEINAAKAKEIKNTEYKDNMAAATSLVDGMVIPDGVSRGDLILYAAGKLNAGVTVTSLNKEMSEGLADNRFVYDGDTAPTTGAEATPAPTVDTGPETPLDRQMNEALGDQSSAAPMAVEPEAEATPVLSNVDAPETAGDSSYQEASLGNDWEQRFRDRQAQKKDEDTNVLVASLDSQTDVTNPAGLGGGEGSAADVVLANNTGTPSESFRATTGALKLRPKAKESAAKELKVESITSYAEALAAVTALTGVAGQEDKLRRASFLLDQFTSIPDLGGMDAQQLQEFIASAPNNPGFANLDPQVMQGTLSRAEGYLADLNMAQLPSLTETDLTKLEGVQADLRSNRYNFDVSDTYKTELANRISALQAKEEAEKLAGIVFDEKYVERLGFLKYNEIQSDSSLSPAEKIQAFELWKSNEGRQLQELLRFGDKPDKPQEINNLEELATQNLMNSEEYTGAGQARQQEMVLSLKSALSGQKKDTLTSSQYAAMYAQKTQDLTSDDPAVAAAARSWFDNVAPALEDGMQAAATASAKPGEQNSVTITYTDEQGNTRRGSGTKTQGGYTMADGSVVPQGQVTQVRSEDERDQVTKLRTSISGPLTKQRNSMAAMVDLSAQAYALEELAVNDPTVLTLVGAGSSAIASAKREANTLLTMLRAGMTTDNPNGFNSQSVVERVMQDFLKAEPGITAESAENYKQFAAKLTRFVFAAGKTLGQEGNGFSNQDYNNILSALTAGNGIESFVKNMRSFVSERAISVDAGAVGIRNMGEVQELSEYGEDLGTATMTYEEYAQSDLAPEDYFAWLNSPVNSLRRDKEPEAATASGQYVKGADNVYRWVPSTDGGTE